MLNSLYPITCILFSIFEVRIYSVLFALLGLLIRTMSALPSMVFSGKTNATPEEYLNSFIEDKKYSFRRKLDLLLFNFSSVNVDLS